MSSGPTQNYDDASLGRWKPRPVLAGCVRVLLVALPSLVALAFGCAAVRWAPADRVGLSPWWWLVVEMTIAAVLLVLASRVTRRLLPVSSLLRLTLYFPDRSPSRFAVALRRVSSDALRERVETARRRGEPLDVECHDAGLLLDLVAAISEHDRATRGHSERVQAYTALIAEELGMSDEDVATLSWAALLHDIGKLWVPAELLNKSGRPTDAEWAVLAIHPSAGVEIAAPLAGWLGRWLDVVGQHHERWDGGGYPLGLARDAISRGARIVAVADAYDAITSARSYKKPLPAAAARAELARCSGAQFDPEVVRAFLRIGLGRLRLVAGPAPALSALPGLRSIPGLTSLAASAPVMVAAVVAAVVGTTIAVTGPAAAYDPSTLPTRLSAGSGATRTTSLVTTDGGAALDPSASDAPSVEGSARATAEPTPGATTAPTGPSSAPSTAPSTDVAAPSPGPVSSGPAPQPSASAHQAVPTSSASTGSACQAAQSGATEMAGADLRGCNLAGRRITGNYAAADLTGAALTGAVLTQLDLSDAKLNGTTLDGASISATSFDRAQLTGASFQGATLTHVSFLGAALAPAALRYATVTDCTFDDDQVSVR